MNYLYQIELFVAAYPSFANCAQQNIPAKYFKICLYIFIVFHFMQTSCNAENLTKKLFLPHTNQQELQEIYIYYLRKQTREQSCYWKINCQGTNIGLMQIVLPEIYELLCMTLTPSIYYLKNILHHFSIARARLLGTLKSPCLH